MNPTDVVKAAAHLGLETSGRGEVWSIYAGGKFHKLSSPETLYEVLAWAAEIMVEHEDTHKAKKFVELANVSEKWID